MADMISALKALYDALGGTLSNIPDGATNADVIEAIAAQIDEGGGGGGSLPAVTSDDNGDVLTVVEGTWAKAAPSGGGLFIIHADEDETTSITTLDKTWQEIWDAFVGGQVPVIDYVYEETEGKSASRAYIGQIWAEDNEWALDAYSPYLSIEPGQVLTGLDGEVFTATSANGYPDTSGSGDEG